MFFKVMIDNVGDGFFKVLRISTHISLGLHFFVMQKQTLGEVLNWMVIWWQVVSRILKLEIIKIW